MEKYRGDTFIFPFTLQDERGSSQSFLTGDKLRFGAKKNTSVNDYDLYQEMNVPEQVEEVQFQFEPEETSKLEKRDYIVELELERNGQVDTIYQETLTVKGDVNRYVPKTNSGAEANT